MSQRLDELALRRQALLLRSERLRADFSVDQHQVLEALRGVDRFLASARRAAPAVLAVAGGLFLVRALRRRPRAVAATAATAGVATAAARAGLISRTMFWISLARRVMPYVPLLREMWLSRSSPRSGAPAVPRR